MSDLSLVLDSLCKSYTLPAPLFRRRNSNPPRAKKALAGVSLTLGPGLYAFWAPTARAKAP